MSRESPSLDRVLDPIFSGDTARRVIEFQIDARSQERLEYLRLRSGEGALTPAERAEYERFVERLDLIATLQADARAASAGIGSHGSGPVLVAMPPLAASPTIELPPITPSACSVG